MSKDTTFCKTGQPPTPPRHLSNRHAASPATDANKKPQHARTKRAGVGEEYLNIHHKLKKANSAINVVNGEATEPATPAATPPRLSKPERREYRLADAERELDRVECDLYGAIVLSADDHVRDLLQRIRERVVVALGVIRWQRGEDRE